MTPAEILEDDGTNGTVISLFQICFCGYMVFGTLQRAGMPCN